MLRRELQRCICFVFVFKKNGAFAFPVGAGVPYSFFVSLKIGNAPINAPYPLCNCTEHAFVVYLRCYSFNIPSKKTPNCTACGSADKAPIFLRWQQFIPGTLQTIVKQLTTIAFSASSLEAKLRSSLESQAKVFIFSISFISILLSLISGEFLSHHLSHHLSHLL